MNDAYAAPSTSTHTPSSILQMRLERCGKKTQELHAKMFGGTYRTK